LGSFDTLESRRQSIVQHLIRRLIEGAVVKQCQSLKLEVMKCNHQAIRVYEGAGFSLVQCGEAPCGSLKPCSRILGPDVDSD